MTNPTPLSPAPHQHAPIASSSPTTLIAVGLIQAWILVIFIGCPILLGYLIITGEQGQLKRMLNDPAQTPAQKDLARRQLFQLKAAD